jgi:hypothetical protein
MWQNMFMGTVSQTSTIKSVLYNYTPWKFMITSRDIRVTPGQARTKNHKVLKTNVYVRVGKILDTGCLMPDKIRIITFKNPVSPPDSPEGEADGGQAETSIQHLLHKGSTICYQCFLPQNSKKISIKVLTTHSLTAGQ